MVVDYPISLEVKRFIVGTLKSRMSCTMRRTIHEEHSADKAIRTARTWSGGARTKDADYVRKRRLYITYI